MHFLKIIGLFVAVVHIGHADTGLTYEQAFPRDRLWPGQVKPLADLHDESGKKQLSGRIPVVFIRAYEDGKLAVFTPREEGYDFLWVTKDGKRIEKAKDLAAIEGLHRQPSPMED